MKKNNVEMTEDDYLRYYTNKIVEDAIRSCSQFDTIVDMHDYLDDSELKKHEKRLFELLFRDERIADIYINEDFVADMDFYTDYCPFYYDKGNIKDLSIDKEIIILEKFIKYIDDVLYRESDRKIRKLINDFSNKYSITFLETKDTVSNILKKDIIETGFIEKYLENDNEVYLTYDKIPKFKDLLGKTIENLKLNLQQEDEEEY